MRPFCCFWGGGFHSKYTLVVVMFITLTSCGGAVGTAKYKQWVRKEPLKLIYNPCMQVSRLRALSKLKWAGKIRIIERASALETRGNHLPRGDATRGAAAKSGEGRGENRKGGRVTRTIENNILHVRVSGNKRRENRSNYGLRLVVVLVH